MPHAGCKTDILLFYCKLHLWGNNAGSACKHLVEEEELWEVRKEESPGTTAQGKYPGADKLANEKKKNKSTKEELIDYKLNVQQTSRAVYAIMSQNNRSA